MAVTPSKIHWDHIPVEIRQMILKCLLQNGCSLASLATVSREWQTVIEQQNFARIKVTPSSLGSLDQMITRNRKLVRYVWFCVELETYDCTRRGTWEFTLLPSVTQAWQAVAINHQDIRPVFVDEVLDHDTVKSYDDAIHCLELSESVIRPVSLQQIRIEHQIVEAGARDLDSLRESRLDTYLTTVVAEATTEGREGRAGGILGLEGPAPGGEGGGEWQDGATGRRSYKYQWLAGLHQPDDRWCASTANLDRRLLKQVEMADKE
ncbi:hypothetical protein NM208_g10550 [Fusarium decemcellulare]|uniref:Uncharacterized protein n=1 Tax=Fusarium decemcellulare TaxID=57161 RepID=A0ACC1RXL1_9HYPO|nr:hypothetical protein NM208_g10550 [Fusarium decemcellulare]